MLARHVTTIRAAALAVRLAGRLARVLAGVLAVGLAGRLAGVLAVRHLVLRNTAIFFTQKEGLHEFLGLNA